MKHLILYCLMGCAAVTHSQSDTLYLYQAYTGFSNQQKSEWTGFENNWQFDQYQKLEAKAHIKHLDCKSCESFYADIYLEVDSQGKVSKALCIGGKNCGHGLNPGLRKNFEESLIHNTFRTIRNKTFIARFGHILKC